MIVRPETTRLTPIPQALPAEPDIDIDERWTLSGADDSATVRIETRYRAAEADRVRGELHHRSAEDMSRQYLNYYLTMYPGIRAVGPIASRDDPAENVVVTTEDYAVPAIWTVAADGRSQQLDLVASGIRDLLRVPTIRQRALPLAVPYPVFVRQAMHVTMPSGFTIPAETVRIDRQELAVERTLAVQGDTLELGLELKTLRDVVEPAAVEGHLQALDQVFVASVFSLTRPTPGLVLPWRPHWPAFVVAFVSSVAAAIAAGAVYWRASRPRPALVAPGPSGIGGWLLLPAIGLLVTPIRMFSLTEEMLPLFDANVVEALTPPWLRVGILTELAFNLTTFVWWGLLATLFVEKRRELPPVIIVFLVFQAVALVGDFWLTSLVLPTVPGDGSPASGAVIRAIIWGSYFAASRRVKATFVR